MADGEARWLKRFKILWDYGDDRPPVHCKWPPKHGDPPKPEPKYRERLRKVRDFFAFNVTWGEPWDDNVLDVVSKCVTKGVRAIQFGKVVSTRDKLWYVPKGRTTLDLQPAIHIRFIGDYSLWFWPWDATVISTRYNQHIYHMKVGTKIIDRFPAGAQLFLVKEHADISERYEAPLKYDEIKKQYYYKVPKRHWGYIISSVPLTNTISREEYLRKQELEEQQRSSKDRHYSSKDHDRSSRDRRR